MKVEKMKESRRRLSWLPKAALVALLGAAVVFAGCSSDDDDGDDNNTEQGGGNTGGGGGSGTSDPTTGGGSGTGTGGGSTDSGNTGTGGGSTDQGGGGSAGGNTEEEVPANPTTSAPTTAQLIKAGAGKVVVVLNLGSEYSVKEVIPASDITIGEGEGAITITVLEGVVAGAKKIPVAFAAESDAVLEDLTLTVPATYLTGAEEDVEIEDTDHNARYVYYAEDYNYSSFDFTAADNAVLTADSKELAVAQTVEIALSIDNNVLTMTNTNSQTKNNRRYGYTKGTTLPEGNFVIEFDAVLAATASANRHLEFCITTNETTAKKNLATEDSKNSGTYSGYSLADNNVLFLIQQQTNTDVWVLKEYGDADDDEDADVGPWNNSDVTADIARSSWNHYKIIYNRDTEKATVAITDTDGASLLKRGEESIANAEITTSGISGTSAFMAGLMMSDGNSTTKLDNIVVTSAATE